MNPIIFLISFIIGLATIIKIGGVSPEGFFLMLVLTLIVSFVFSGPEIKDVANESNVSPVVRALYIIMSLVIIMGFTILILGFIAMTGIVELFVGLW